MKNIVLYQIPSSEIEFLLQQLNHPYYWNPAHSHLMRWDLRLTTTDMAIASNPLSEIADLTGDIILDGLLDDGINSKLCHQIVNAFREQRNQTLYLIGDRFDCPHKLFPFVNILQWQLPDSVTIANFLKQKSIYCDAVYRASLGLYIGELNNVLQMYANLQGEGLASAISDYKIRKLQGRGITVVPQPDCDAAGMDVLDGILAEITDLLKPEAYEAGLQFPRGTILIGPPGTGKSLFAKSAASRLGLPLLCADWAGLISPIPGESVANLRTLLQSAEASAPCILFWDDYDKAFASADLSKDAGEEKKLAGMLLTWLQDRTAPVYTIVTLNRINQIPPELKRRFDRTIFVDLPHEGARHDIFGIHLLKYCGAIPNWSDRDWKILISEYGECTPDEIGKAVYLAAVRSYRQGRTRQITIDDLLYQRKQFTPANIANPAQIQSIRNNSKFALKASSDDRSKWRVEPDPIFKTMLGR
ncbi:MAG: AAA family ATPase [Cyanobacteria bacterium CAN_BIN43]|nr:AAA family ATPase [Cyanobacteria bacterium CAN_BIN43]